MAESDVLAGLDDEQDVTNAPKENRFNPGPILPDDCPVRPLGLNGQTYFYLDSNFQLIALDAGKHGKAHLLALFSRTPKYLWRQFPRKNEDGETVGWRAEIVQEVMMQACAYAGIWNPQDRERGAGAWLGQDGELILHCGDEILVGAGGRIKPGWFAPGLIGQFVYPAAPALPRPHPADDRDNNAAVDRILSALQTWSWKGPIDALLLLGWLAAAMVGGALDWRPAAWVTGGSGSGKSTLQRLIHLITGGAIISISDATAAGIWQHIGQSTLPVAIDESEAEEDNRQLNNVIKLARLAASGGLVLRGGQDHKAAKFQSRNCFLFSSILVPPLTPQDRSRLAILELGHLGVGSVGPDLRGEQWALDGQAMLWRLQAKWHFVRPAIEAYAGALTERGWDSRGCDQFGTLLALADLVRTGELPRPDNIEAVVDQLGISETDEIEPDEELMIKYLKGTVVDVFRSGIRRSMGEWIRRAAGPPWSKDFDDAYEVDGDAQKAIGLYGLRVSNERDPISGQHEDWLYIANSHRGLAELFAGSHWAARNAQTGVWVQAVDRLHRSEKVRKAVRFSDGYVSRARRVPLMVVFPEG